MVFSRDTCDLRSRLLYPVHTHDSAKAKGHEGQEEGQLILSHAKSGGNSDKPNLFILY